jgi:hypothetical protein
MHRLPSHAALVRFRLSAWLFLLGVVLLVAGTSYLVYALVIGDNRQIIIASAIFATGVLSIIMQWFTSARARCPLCLTPSMAKKNCSKNRNARRLLGSYRLRVATSIIFNGHFRCPYCNEPTVLEVRKRPQ